MQLSLAFTTSLFFLFLSPFRSLTTSLVLSIITACSRSRKAYQREHLRTEIDKFFRRKLALLKTVTVDLQEAQCFFMIASQIAALIVLAKERKDGDLGNSVASILGSATIFQITNNYVLLILISICGQLPISLANYVLLLGNNWSLYTTGLSAVTVIISFYVSMKTEGIRETLQSIGQPGQLLPFTPADRLKECGNNPPPVVYCVNPEFNFDAIEAATTVCSGVISGAIIVLSIFALVRRRTITSLKQAGESDGSALAKILILFGFLIFFGLIALTLHMFYRVQQAGAVDTHNWSVGQVVSIWTLSPVFLKCIYGSFCMFFKNTQLASTY